MVTEVLECEPVPSSVRSARLFVVDKLQEWRCDDLVDGVALLTSELATNAVKHTGRPFTVGVGRDGDRIRVEVADAEPTPPTPYREEDDRGLFHGLNVVESLATAWGTEPKDDGKVVWFELAGASNDRSDDPNSLASLRDLRGDSDEGLPSDLDGKEWGHYQRGQEVHPMVTKHELREDNERLRAERDDGRVVRDRDPEVVERDAPRRSPIWTVLLILLILAVAAVIAFFAFGGSADIDTEGDLEVPEVDVDVNAPDVNVDSEEAPPADAEADASQ